MRRRLVLWGVMAVVVVLLGVPLIFGKVHGLHTWADRMYMSGWTLGFLVNGFGMGAAWGPDFRRWLRASGREMTND